MASKKIKIDITNEDQAYWNTILANTAVLDENGEPMLDGNGSDAKPITLSMSRGSLGSPSQRNAVLEYLESTAIEVVKDSEVPTGFSTSDELSARYIEETKDGA